MRVELASDRAILAVSTCGASVRCGKARAPLAGCLRGTGQGRALFAMAVLRLAMFVT